MQPCIDTAIRKCLSGVGAGDGEGSGTSEGDKGCSQRPGFHHLEEKEGRKTMLVPISITSPVSSGSAIARRRAFYLPGFRELVNDRHFSSKLHK